MDWKRIWRHLNTGTAAVRRCFPPETLDALAQATRDWESRHPGEIRFAVEDSLPLSQLWRGQTPRERAIEVFSQLRIWDTEHSNGVLIYVLLADRDVELVADRGVARGRVAQAEWDACAQVLREHFRAGRYREGALAGVAAVAALLERHPPGPPDGGNELPDAPAVL